MSALQSVPTNGRTNHIMPKNVEFSTEKIGPKEAEALMKANTRNRNLRAAKVAVLAGAMTRDEWVFNGDAIRIASSGKLLDGQHRLAAIIACKRTIPMLVVRGLPEKSQETMDTGSARSLSDMLKLRGETYSNDIAASLRVLWKFWRHGTFQNRFLRPTAQELMALLDQHPHVRDTARRARRLRGFVPMPVSIMGALDYLFSQVSVTDAELFFSRLEAGEGLESHDPILVLRNQCVKQGQRRVSPIVVGAWTVKAWNYWREGEPVGLYRWSPTQGEAFPTIDGLGENSEFSPLIYSTDIKRAA